MSIESLFTTPAALPMVPKVVQQLIDSFGRDDVSIDEIALQLTADPVLCAKTLRLANSAYFHVSRTVSTVDDALRMLGFVMVRNLVTGCGVAGAFKGVQGMDMPAFWRYSLHTACAASWLAQQADRNTDQTFTVGLIHGLGHLVMHMAKPQGLAQLDKEVHPLAPERVQAETARFGYHHGQVSAELARRWNFPPEIAEPLRQIPNPLGFAPVNTVAAIVHVAAWRARVAHFHWSNDKVEASCPVQVGAAASLPLRWLPEQATLGGLHNALVDPMPSLADLSDGLEGMFA
ncbi:MAG: HDOD domain-containing protein [Vitreoscilla sp.]|nr:HDOD domain-containing protein [Burkholderiales bacterium]MBP6338532.1 HDOD domain-containing protein [Vitreoscilla sp.]MBP6675982.1 HDOD domain-containing protein [Vitreoscilla sp.]